MKSKGKFLYLIYSTRKRSGCFLLLTVCCTSLMSSRPVFAEPKSWPAGPSIQGEAAVVMDVASGTVLYEKNSHEQLYPASITKILTALLAIEASQMEEQVTFSYNAVHRTEGSGIWRDVDEVMTMEQCLYALMLNSANECAYAIAEHVGGTYEDFVSRMNERAEALGCTDTHFNNPHGLPDEEHYTSCYDMALIAGEAIKNETFRQIIGTKQYQIPPTNKHPDEITYLRNHQKMLFKGEKYYYEYCIGGKTGYTEAAGNTLVTYAEKDGMTLVCVTMKEKTTCQYEDSLKLLKYCFENFATYNIAENIEETIAENSGQTLTEAEYLSTAGVAEIDRNASVVLPAGVEFSETVQEVVYDEQKENVAGTLRYKYGDRVVGAADIVLTGQDVADYPFDSGKGQDASKDKGESHSHLKEILLVSLGIPVLLVMGFFICRYRYEILDRLADLRFGRQNGSDRAARRRRRRRRRRQRQRRRTGRR